MPDATPHVIPARSDEHHAAAPDREIQELWFALARRRWRSVVLVPADRGETTAALARSLADVGRWLHEEATTLVLMSDPLDYACATQIVGPLGLRPTEPPRAEGRVVISVQPVIVEPLGLSVVQEADATIVCIELGHTRMASLERTIELIGREHVVGSFLLPRHRAGQR